MNSDSPSSPASSPLELDTPARRVAEIAARQLDMPVTQWVALAVLNAAAEQDNIVGSDVGETDDAAQSLARLEAKLDRLLTELAARGVGNLA